MNETSFLAQLEQRTEQLKITLANLEAEKVRIENQVATIQPLIPHYDALVAAERALQDAHIQLHESRAEERQQPPVEEGAWGTQQQPEQQWGQ